MNALTGASSYFDFLSLRIISICDNSVHSDKTFIVDDTVTPKTGKDIELVSYHFDHKIKRSILGNLCIQLGYHNGINFFPVDIAFHTSKKRPNTRVRDIDKRTNGWHRRKEALRKRTDDIFLALERKKFLIKFSLARIIISNNKKRK